jgi:hypothetical protein
MKVEQRRARAAAHEVATAIENGSKRVSVERLQVGFALFK